MLNNYLRKLENSISKLKIKLYNIYNSKFSMIRNKYSVLTNQYIKYVGANEIIVHIRTFSFKCVFIGAEFALPNSECLETFIPIGKDIKKTIIQTIKNTKKIDTMLI